MREMSFVQPFEWHETRAGGVVRTTSLRGAAHLFTTRALTLRGPSADAQWALLAETIGVADGRLFAPKQVHGNDVLVVRPSDRAPASLNDPLRPQADIVITADPDSAIAVQTADCVAVLLADQRTGAVAAAHAGWRGTAANVAGRAVAAMHAEFGSQPGDLLAVIGPSIGRCCYQVGEDVVDTFAAAGFGPGALEAWFHPETGTRRYRLDVPLANHDQLIAAGLPRGCVFVSGLCTACHPEIFFSYRREGAGTGRLAAVIRPADR